MTDANGSTIPAVQKLHPLGPSVRLIPLSEVIRLTGRSRSRIYQDIADGKFCRPVKDGTSSRWVESEIVSFISARIAERDANGGAA